ncbi:MAG: hypothetical protein IJ599_01700 [Alphaproteobacteria bacterium]|nr:hypothetical protein [Alphaproteobacteria bacterium]
MLELFFPKGCSHCTDLLVAKPSSHAAPTGLLSGLRPTGLLSGLRPTGLTAARQIRNFSSPLLEKTIIHTAFCRLLTDTLKIKTRKNKQNKLYLRCTVYIEVFFTSVN